MYNTAAVRTTVQNDKKAKIKNSMEVHIVK